MSSVDLASLMNTTPESLAQIQHETLKEHVLDVIDKVREMVAHDTYEPILSDDAGITVYSPAGDCMGTDTYHVNFGFKPEEEMDIRDACEMLQRLYKLAKGEEE